MFLTKNRAIIFVHYDKNHIVDNYIYHYLKELKKNASYLLFVSTSNLVEKDVENLAKYCTNVIVRENIGYDFMSYKVGLESFDYLSYDEVVICNDSVYGPLYSLENVFNKMQNDTCAFWGITDNKDIGYHLQSYFLVFKKSVIQSDAFKSFWDNVEILNDKNEIIKKYEVGLTKHLLQNGYSSAVYSSFEVTKLQQISIFIKKLTLHKIINKLRAIISGQDSVYRIGEVNTIHYFWKELLLDSKIPFIKIELLRDNPKEMDIDDFENVIQYISDYDTSLIKNHLKRMKVNNK